MSDIFTVTLLQWNKTKKKTPIRSLKNGTNYPLYSRFIFIKYRAIQIDAFHMYICFHTANSQLIVQW